MAMSCFIPGWMHPSLSLKCPDPVPSAHPGTFPWPKGQSIPVKLNAQRRPRVRCNRIVRPQDGLFGDAPCFLTGETWTVIGRALNTVGKFRHQILFIVLHILCRGSHHVLPEVHCPATLPKFLANKAIGQHPPGPLHPSPVTEPLPKRATLARTAYLHKGCPPSLTRVSSTECQLVLTRTPLSGPFPWSRGAHPTTEPLSLQRPLRPHYPRLFLCQT
jgi:hypothetical protein